MDREWALTEEGKELVERIMASGIEDREFALRVAEELVSAEELYGEL